ncbi:SUKH-4 family immunity protein [Streptomyces coffeae]|uniref:SUKH-4 family immunity protein n=1 Tax=Streptomyces coffeae TaxID=621382 RepID=A0ABS1NJK2_9ACTN|nr:SUKH-4 family immunity protein [Streptomyces coffeae]MBL1100194.1 SUKH-4 family immunity protein [Streptomyces coffeae]
MISQAQAAAIADRWLNPQGAPAPQRQVATHEFDLGWVVWAVPPPPERDPVTGQRRPPAEIGTSCGVVDRRTGELTVWPSVPVEEVVRMYQEKHGGAGAGSGVSAERPVTGPGNTTVFTYVDPSNGEETSLFRNSAPGLPHSEYQAMAEIQRMGVPPQNVVAIHTDLSSSLLPGGYPGEMLQGAFPNAQFSCTQNYGLRPEERAEGVAGLLQHVEMMHQIAGQQPPPRPHRVPVRADVTPAQPMRDVALGRHLAEVFGADGVRRYDADDVAQTQLPEAAKATLTWGGLPADIPFFFTADRAEAPPRGGLFTDAATYLREVGTQANESTLNTLSGHVRIGSDGVAAITVQCTAPRHMTTPVGQVWAVPPRDAMGRRVNTSISAFARSLALLSTTRQRMRGMDPVAAGEAVAAFQEQLAAIDATALDDPKNWWSVIVEQMWHGLF